MRDQSREAGLTIAAGVLVGAFALLFLFWERQFFWTDDFQSQHLAGFCDVARAWRSGEFPLVSPYSWQGGALAGEYQYGVFSVVLTLLAVVVFALDLPLPLAAAVFSVVHLGILAAGAFRLGRWRGLPVQPAMLVALVASLNGFIFIWGAKVWFPALASFAWLPWVWWGLERALREQGGMLRWLPAGIFVYLVMTAGWPFTVLMILLLSFWLLLRNSRPARRLGPWWPIGAAWAVGIGLSAPAWLMLKEYAGATLRGHTPFGLSGSWMVPLDSLPGLIFPATITNWNVYGDRKLHMCAELAGGLVPLALLAATLPFLGKAWFNKMRWELWLGGVLLVLCLAPGVGNFQHSIRWLPFFFLVLGLLAGDAVASCPRAFAVNDPVGRLRRLAANGGLWAVFLVLLCWIRVSLMNLDPTAATRLYGAALTALCLAWAVIEARGGTWRAWAPCLVVLISSALFFVRTGQYMEVPTWRHFDERAQDRPQLDPQVRYLSVYLRSDLFNHQKDADEPGGEELYLGNSGMYSGIEFVNGYSPMFPCGSTAAFDISLHGNLSEGAAERVLTRQAGPDGLLQLMGVDGLVVSDRFRSYGETLEANGWRRVQTVDGGQVYCRAGPTSPRVRALRTATCTGDGAEALQLLSEHPGSSVPLVLLQMDEPNAQGKRTQQFGPAEVTAVRETRNSVVVDVASQAPDQETLVVFSRPWYPGYRAECDGEPVPVEVLNLTMPAVRLPPGKQGRVTLEYRPRSLILGERLAAATGLVVLLLVVIAAVRRLPRRQSGCQVPAEPVLAGDPQPSGLV